MAKEEKKQIIFLHKGKFIWKFVVSIILNVFLLIIPIYYSKIIDTLSLANFNQVYLYLLLFAFLSFGYRVIEFLNQKAYFNLYLSLYKSFMNLTTEKTFKNSLYSLSRFSLSEYSNIMSEDLETISDFYSTLVIRIVEILEFTYIIIYFFFINNIIGFITLLSSLVVIFLLFYFNRFIEVTNTKRKVKNDYRISLFQEIFLTIKAIKGFNVLNIVKNKLNQAIDEYKVWHIKLNMQRYHLREWTLGIMDFFKIASLFIGIKLIINQQISLGTITIIYSYYGKLSELFTSIIVLSESLNNKKVSEERIHKLFQYAHNYEIDMDNLNDVSGNICFKNVLYGNKIKPYLNNVSFTIKKHSLSVLMGNLDSCKGVFDLLLKYNRYHSGDVLIDNLSIANYGRDNISQIVGLIMEYPTFLNISIKDYLSIFDSNFENIVSVCKYLLIDNDIMSLEQGYETLLKSDGSNLDDDLKYLLSLACIFLKKNKIILIDNIFEHISKKVYQQIWNLIIKLKKEHTIIVISRDINLISSKDVDKIIALSLGQVVASGSHRKLMASHQEYRKMIESL